MSTIERLLALKAMSVGGGGVKYATGTVIHTSGYTLTITHNLGTRKAFCIAQRVNENGETILAEGGSAYNAIFLMGATTDEFVNNHGFTALPITYNQDHTKWNLGESEPTNRDSSNGVYGQDYEETRGADHRFANKEDAYDLYDKIIHPVAIIKNYGKHPGVVFILDAKSESGKQMVAAMNLGSRVSVNGRDVNANEVTTVHGRENVIGDLIKKIESNSDEVLFWDKEKLQAVVNEDAKNKNNRATETVLRDTPGGQFPDHGSTAHLQEQTQDLHDVTIDATPFTRTLSQAGVVVNRGIFSQTVMPALRKTPEKYRSIM